MQYRRETIFQKKLKNQNPAGQVFLLRRGIILNTVLSMGGRENTPILPWEIISLFIGKIPNITFENSDRLSLREIDNDLFHTLLTIFKKQESEIIDLKIVVDRIYEIIQQCLDNPLDNSSLQSALTSYYNDADFWEFERKGTKVYMSIIKDIKTIDAKAWESFELATKALDDRTRAIKNEAIAEVSSTFSP